MHMRINLDICVYVLLVHRHVHEDMPVRIHVTAMHITHTYIHMYIHTTIQKYTYSIYKYTHIHT